MKRWPHHVGDPAHASTVRFTSAFLFWATKPVSTKLANCLIVNVAHAVKIITVEGNDDKQSRDRWNLAPCRNKTSK